MNTTDYKNILIIKPSSLGDIVHALPILMPLRQALPEAKISWMVRSEFASFMECVQGIDDLVLFDRRGMSKWWRSPKSFSVLKSLTSKLCSEKYDLVLDLQCLLRSGVFSIVTGSKVRVGLAGAREFASLFYNVKVAHNSVHIIDWYKEVLQRIHIPMSEFQYPLRIPPDAQSSVDQLLKENQLSQSKLAILIPGSAHAYKCWPADHFAELAGRLSEKFGFSIAAVGSKGEIPIIEELIQKSSGQIVNFAGKTNLIELTAILHRADLVIGNDTGPSHIADALGRPTVIIFGQTNPLRLGPYQKPDAVAALDLDKRGREIKCKNPQWAIEKVTVEMVMEKIKNQIDH